MARGKAEDAGGLTPAKDDNAAPHHFGRRTLPIFRCVDYKSPPPWGRAFACPQDGPPRAAGEGHARPGERINNRYILLNIHF